MRSLVVVAQSEREGARSSLTSAATQASQRPQWYRWGREWQRWNHSQQLLLEEVRELGRLARAEVGNGHGAWYEFVTSQPGATGTIFYYAPDGVSLDIHQELLAINGQRLKWHHLRNCQCGRCAHYLNKPRSAAT